MNGYVVAAIIWRHHGVGHANGESKEGMQTRKRSQERRQQNGTDILVHHDFQRAPDFPRNAES